jgi:hypothetical protein
MPDLALDLRYLRFAVAAAEHGSFWQTAVALDVSPSMFATTSRAIFFVDAGWANREWGHFVRLHEGFGYPNGYAFTSLPIVGSSRKQTMWQVAGSFCFCSKQQAQMPQESAGCAGTHNPDSCDQSKQRSRAWRYRRGRSKISSDLSIAHA